MLATNISIHPTNWLATHFQSTAYALHVINIIKH